MIFGAKASDIAPNAQFKVTASLQFSGAQRIAVLAYGKTTHLAMQGDWPNPGFDGGFLPVAARVRSKASPPNGRALYCARRARGRVGRSHHGTRSDRAWRVVH